MKLVLLLVISSALFGQEAGTLATPKTRHYYLEGIKVIAEKPEESASKYELALDIPFIWNTTADSVSQKVFYNQVDNLIDRSSDAYDNIDEIESYGYEATLKIRFLWEHRIDYFLIKYGKESDHQLLEVAENSINIIEKMELPFKLKFKYKATWKDTRKTEIEGFELDPYWLHPVYFSRELQDITVMSGLENILDENYLEQYGYPGTGFNFVISLEAGLF